MAKVERAAVWHMGQMKYHNLTIELRPDNKRLVLRGPNPEDEGVWIDLADVALVAKTMTGIVDEVRANNVIGDEE